MVLKNALLSIKKNIGKTILLFVLMALIANLVIAGLSIKEATVKSIAQIRESLGNEVTLSYNMQNIMKNREKGESMESVVQDISVSTADLLKDLDHVKNYNYTVTVGVNSSKIDPVEMKESTQNNAPQGGPQDSNNQVQESDFTVSGNTTMEYLTAFTNENYVLKKGRLLSTEDVGKNYVVISEDLATDNNLSVGNSFKVYSTDSNGKKTTVTLKVVGIYTINSTEMNRSMSNRQNPYNTLYTTLSTAQKLNGSTKTISSASYYIDDAANIDSFKEASAQVDSIDWDTYTLDADDRAYEMSVSSLENMAKFANIFLGVVVVAGSAILALILVLTLRSRFYEFGVFLSMGQSKAKIILQQLAEVGLIALVAFTLSLGTGKMVSNTISNMLESSANSRPGVTMTMEKSENSSDSTSDSNSSMNKMFDHAMKGPQDTELDVSVSGSTVTKLAGITSAICVVSVLLPSLYVMRLSPREILIKKEG